MSLGKNLQFLRKMHNSMTQEALAEKMKVSRQTISKWESDSVYPEMEKVFDLCDFFSCTIDRLLRENMSLEDEAYSEVSIRTVPAFSYIRYTVISPEPEEDAMGHVRRWAVENKLEPQVIGWDFPFLSLEQVNVYHMHGYTAACIVPEGFVPRQGETQVIRQEAGRYAGMTIREPFKAPFKLIPNAYKIIISYMEINGLKHMEAGRLIPCFERSYEREGVSYMDILISVED